MKLLLIICLCALIVPRFWFNLVSENTGYAFDYDNQTHHGVVWELLDETFRGKR